MASAYQYLQLEKFQEGQILVIKFSRPESYNAMNRAMMDELIHAANNLEEDPGIRVVIITGQGTSFMAGADIKEYASASDEEFFAFQRKGTSIYRSLEECSLPVIAAVQGYALGGGFEIALACDFILASEKAELGLPEVHLGLVPGGGGTQRLIQKVGLNRARELLLTGDRYDSRQLCQWGIVNKVLPETDFFAEVLQFAAKLSRRPKAALTQLKQLARLSLPSADLSSKLFYEGQTCYHLFKTAEAQERIDTFANKGKPK